MNSEKLDAMVLYAIKSYTADRPAMAMDLWSMIAIQKQTERRFVLDRSIQRLKLAGKITYSRKPAGWVAS